MDRRRFLAATGVTSLGLGLTAAAGPAGAATNGPAGAGTAAAGTPYFNRRIPDEAHTTIGQFAPQGITSFAFTPSNGWVLTTQTGGYFARGIPQECFDTLVQMVGNGTRIHCVAFPPEGGNRWVITGDKGLSARGIAEECWQTLLSYHNSGQQVAHVAFPPAGGNRWVVVGANGAFTARGIDDECYQMMRNLSTDGRRVTRVSFPYPGGWVVVAQDTFHARGIDEECYQQMNSFAAGGWELHNLAFGPVGNAWSIISRGPAPSLPPARARQVEAAVGNGQSLRTRMSAWNTPGAAIAVLVDNKVAWSTGYGWLEGNGGGAAHPESAFQAASISKAVAALGVMRLVQTRTDLPLTTDVRTHLGWTLNRRTCVTSTAVPTVDRLLAHRAGVIGGGSTFPLTACSGFTSGGGGFGGYGPTATVPTLLQVMNGQGNSPRIELSTAPGAAFHYSGAGFVLLQRMVEQLTGQTLTSYMNTEVFAPLGMTTSSYALNPAFELASGHDDNGVIAGRRNRFPESAAAGLYTSVLDLARLVRYLNRGWTAAGNLSGPLNRTSIRTMLSVGPTPGRGRGFALGNVGTNDFWYGHGGSNYGFHSEFGGYPERGTGYAVMVNGNHGELVGEIVSAIRSVYGWA